MAAKLGYDWCEIDAQASSDGVAMVYHDFVLADGRQLSKLSSKQLTQQNIGGHTRSGENILMPSLLDCLKVAAQSDLALVVEIKSHYQDAAHNVAAVAKALRQVSDVEVMVSSFEPEVLLQFGKLISSVPLALNVERIPQLPPSGCANVHCAADHADVKHVKRMLDAGLGVYAWTVNDVAVGSRLLANGVHGFFTDSPQVRNSFTDLK